MDRKNIGKVLGIAGLIVLGKSQLPTPLNIEVGNDENAAPIIQAKEVGNPVEKAFGEVGIPQLRMFNISSSIATTISAGVYVMPSLIDLDF